MDNKTAPDTNVKTAITIPDFVEPHIEIKTVGPEILFNCETCNLDFENCMDFEIHKNRVHGQIKTCPICHYLFRRQDHLKRHLRTVHCDEKSICPICIQDCKEQDSLSQHIRECHAHEADNLQALVSHKKSHVPTKYTCNICSACFKRQDHLNRHVKSLHLNEVVTCEVCNKIFKRRDHLLRHRREQHGVFESRVADRKLTCR